MKSNIKSRLHEPGSLRGLPSHLQGSVLSCPPTPSAWTTTWLCHSQKPLIATHWFPKKIPVSHPAIQDLHHLIPNYLSYGVGRLYDMLQYYFYFFTSVPCSCSFPCTAHLLSTISASSSRFYSNTTSSLKPFPVTTTQSFSFSKFLYLFILYYFVSLGWSFDNFSVFSP